MVNLKQQKYCSSSYFIKLAQESLKVKPDMLDKGMNKAQRVSSQPTAFLLGSSSDGHNWVPVLFLLLRAIAFCPSSCTSAKVTHVRISFWTLKSSWVHTVKSWQCSFTVPKTWLVPLLQMIFPVHLRVTCQCAFQSQGEVVTLGRQHLVKNFLWEPCRACWVAPGNRNDGTLRLA